MIKFQTVREGKLLSAISKHIVEKNQQIKLKTYVDW